MALLAVTACVLLMVGRGTAQIVARLGCSSHPVLINVAVSTDVAPAIQLIAQTFNREQRQAAGHCVAVQVNPVPPAAAAAQIDGQRPKSGQPPIDAWIPDSSLWVDQARGFAVGAQTVQPAGFSVARSPLMIVMPASAAAHTVAFGKAGWRLLLPRRAGGPPVPAGFRVDIPDPSQSAAGLATLIEIGRLLGPGQAARVRFARFVLSAAVTPYFDNPPSLASFVSLAAPPLNGEPVTVTTEQAVLAYDAANPRQPLAASYPTGNSSALGSPELDYPYVVTTSNSRLRYAAATVFGQFLRSRYAVSVIRFAGFRSGGSVPGVPDRFPATFGLASQLLQVAPPASASEAPATLQVWNKLALGSRDLAVLDVSAAMGKPANPADPTGPSLERELTQTASAGLTYFAASANIGLWEYGYHLSGALPYRPLVSVGPLTASLGVISRGAQLERIANSLVPTTSQNVALYGSILAAYKYMQKTYQPNYFNGVIALGSGIENAPGDITAAELIKKLTALDNPSRRVEVIIISFGNPANFPELQQIAAATGGSAYPITNPRQVGAVFFQALAHRLCDPACVAP
jgi:hypothetical protein